MPIISCGPNEILDLTNCKKRDAFYYAGGSGAHLRCDMFFFITSHLSCLDVLFVVLQSPILVPPLCHGSLPREGYQQ
jgi:hypothetical protein